MLIGIIRLSELDELISRTINKNAVKRLSEIAYRPDGSRVMWNDYEAERLNLTSEQEINLPKDINLLVPVLKNVTNRAAERRSNILANAIRTTKHVKELIGVGAVDEQNTLLELDQWKQAMASNLMPKARPKEFPEELWGWVENEEKKLSSGPGTRSTHRLDYRN